MIGSRMNDSQGTEVILHVYWLGDENLVKKTQFLSHIGFGLHHSAIEINGMEFCYGGDVSNSGTGVM